MDECVALLESLHALSTLQQARRSGVASVQPAALLALSLGPWLSLVCERASNARKQDRRHSTVVGSSVLSLSLLFDDSAVSSNSGQSLQGLHASTLSPVPVQM